uniref:Uncharacterized protein n=1 Tax=Anguilla anguilla TaxID=7936 RepID=A0A0E9U9H1_ANGAN
MGLSFSEACTPMSDVMWLEWVKKSSATP